MTGGVLSTFVFTREWSKLGCGISLIVNYFVNVKAGRC